MRAPAARRRARRLGERIVIAAFVATLVAPSAKMLVGPPEPWELAENRHPAPAPTWPASAGEAAELPARFGRWFEDRFGFRRALIRVNALVSARVFGISPHRDVVLGEEGWLFYQGRGVLEVSRGDRPLSRRSLDAWASALERRRRWLAERGASYVFVVVPEKSTIYPEFVPERLRPPAGRSRLDQLVAHLRQHTDVVVVDPRQALRHAAEADHVYYRTDQHFNDLGAWITYREIVAAARGAIPAASALDFDDHLIERRRGRGGDLAAMMALPEDIPEDELLLRPRYRPRLSRDSVMRHGPAPLLTRGESGSGGIVMFRDSYGAWLIPFLAEHFADGTYLWQYEFDRDVIVRSRPTLVVEEVAERRLMQAPPAM